MKLEAIYHFIFPNADKTDGKYNSETNIIEFDSDEAFNSFLVKNNFIVHELGNGIKVVIEDVEDPGIYGRII